MSLVSYLKFKKCKLTVKLLKLVLKTLKVSLLLLKILLLWLKVNQLISVNFFKMLLPLPKMFKLLKLIVKFLSLTNSHTVEMLTHASLMLKELSLLPWILPNKLNLEMLISILFYKTFKLLWLMSQKLNQTVPVPIN